MRHSRFNCQNFKLNSFCLINTTKPIFGHTVPISQLEQEVSQATFCNCGSVILQQFYCCQIYYRTHKKKGNLAVPRTHIFSGISQSLRNAFVRSTADPTAYRRFSQSENPLVAAFSVYSLDAGILF